MDKGSQINILALLIVSVLIVGGVSVWVYAESKETETYTVTLSIGDGSFENNPVEWNLSNGVYTKKFDKDTDFQDIIYDIESTLQREGYEFSHWSLNYDGEKLPERKLTDDVTFYAVWDADKYIVTFDDEEITVTDGETPINSGEEVAYGTELTVTADPKTGHTSVLSASVGTIDADGKYTVTEAVEFTVTWTVNKYTVTWIIEGSDNIETKVDFGATITAPEDPTKEGYTFDGWDPEIPETMPAADMTITATWTAIEYIVTFDDEEITVTDGETPINSGEEVAYGTLLMVSSKPSGEEKPPVVILAAKVGTDINIIGGEGTYKVTETATFITYNIFLDSGGESPIVMDGNFYVVNKDYNDNAVKSDNIGIQVINGDGEENLTGYFNTGCYVKEDGDIISSLKLPDGGTTLKVWVEVLIESDNPSESYEFKYWVFVKYGSVTIGDNEVYMTIEDALAKAESGDTIIVKYNTSFTKADVANSVYGGTEFKVKDGVTLLLPYDNKYSEETGDVDGNNKELVRNNAFTKLTVSEGITLSVDGTLTVNAERTGTGQPHQGYISGVNYSELRLDKESKINVYGELNAIGSVHGEGMVEAYSGAIVRETILNNGWRGGNVTLSVMNNIFPIEQFSIINIECDLKINSDVSYYADGQVHALSMWVGASIGMIGNGDNYMLKLTEGSIMKSFNTDKGEITFELNGNATLQNISLKIFSFNIINTNGKWLPLDGRWHFIIKGESILDVEAQVSFLPGSSLKIEAGATVNVKEGGGLMIFDPYEYLDTGSFNSYPQTGTEKYYRVEPTFIYANDTPAILENNGTLNVSGKIAGRVSGEGDFNYNEEKTEFEIPYIIDGDNIGYRKVILWTGDGYAVSVTAEKPIYTSHDKITLKALMRDSENNLIGDGVSVKFTITKEDIVLSRDVSTSDGYATAIFNIDQGLSIGEYTIEVQVDGISAKGSFTVKAPPPPPSEPCVAEGTLITLADGTQVPVEELTGDELVGMELTHRHIRCCTHNIHRFGSVHELRNHTSVLL